MGRDAIEKEAIMRDDHGATGKILQGFFQRPQCFDIEIIGRFVEQQKIGTRFQHFGEMHAVAFTT